MKKLIFVLLFAIACGTTQVRLVKEDSLKADTDNVKEDIAAFEAEIKNNPDSGFREEKFNNIRDKFLAYTDRCTAVEKSKDNNIRELYDENANIKSELSKTKIQAANDLKIEIEKSAKYRDEAGKFWGIVYTLSGIIILLLLSVCVYVYLQVKNLGTSAVMNSLSLAKKIVI